MLQRLMRLWPRAEGQGWSLAKIHEQLHVPDDIRRNGPPHSTHTGPTENHHIVNVKQFAAATQRCRETFDWKLGQCFAESFIINAAMKRMTYDYDDSAKDDT